MDVFFWSEFSIQKPLHHNAMLRLVMAIAHINIAITVFDVGELKDLGANWFTMPTIESVVILTKSFGDWWLIATNNGANIF